MYCLAWPSSLPSCFCRHHPGGSCHERKFNRRYSESTLLNLTSNPINHIRPKVCLGTDVTRRYATGGGAIDEVCGVDRAQFSFNFPHMQTSSRLACTCCSIGRRIIGDNYRSTVASGRVQSTFVDIQTCLLQAQRQQNTTR